MRKNFSQSIFLSSDIDAEEDNDPRVGLVNLADVMLVFACGLMLALVSYWNLDVSAMNEVVQGDEMKEVRDIEQFKGDNSGSGGFVEKGIVYQDPMTGKYYMVQQEEKGKESKGQAGTDQKTTKDGGKENPKVKNTEGDK